MSITCLDWKRALYCVAALTALTVSLAAKAASTYAYTAVTYAYDTPSGTATTAGWHASGATPACTNFPKGDDDWSDVVFPGGFTFTFGGVAYSGVRIYSNGILAFPTDSSGFWKEYTPQALPITTASTKAAPGGCASTVPANLMLPYWIDIIAGTANDTNGNAVSGASVQYELLGVAPNRRFVISWVNVALFGNSATRYSFQVVLNESAAGTNGNFIYRYTPGSATSGLNAAVGVQLAIADFTQYSFNQSFIDTTIGTAILWYPANQLAAKGAEYRFDESNWISSAGEIKDTSGNLLNASRTTANVTNIAGGKLCRGGLFASNTANNVIDAVATPITPANQGSVSLWYKTTAAWNAADTMIFDATTVANKPFFLMKMASGALKFVITDSAGTTYTAQTSAALTPLASGWIHIAVSWNVKPGNNQTVQQIMSNGNLIATNTTTPFRSTTSGAIGTFSTIYIGDNRTSGITPSGGTPNSANGTIDEVYIYSTEINATQEGADAGLTRSTCTTLDHFHIAHAGTAVACNGSIANIVVEPHDINHALFSLAGTVVAMSTSSTNPVWSSVSTINPVINSGGGVGSYTFANENTVTFGLQDSTVESVNINLNSGGITEHTGAATSCVTQDNTTSPIGSNCDANLNFTQAGFIFSSAAGGGISAIPTQVAGTTSGTFYLRAVQATTTTQACTAALTGANTVNFGYECNNPTTCSASNLMTITGTGVATIQRNNNGSMPGGGYVAVPMFFDANGNAPFTLNFADVGLTTLWASKANSSPALTGSTSFVTTPFGFTVSGIKTTAGAVANPGAANAAGAAFIKAGDAFTATVTATAQGGGTTPNFGREIVPATVSLGVNLVGGTFVTALTNPTAFGTFTNGAATGTTFAWSEVGIITLTPSTNSYLGTNTVTGTTTGNVGRFIPYQFAVATGTATHACVPAALTPFTYFGQDGFTTAFTLTAQNKSGATTQNYAGSFAKLGLTAWANYGFAIAGLPAGSALSASATAPTGTWTTGTASVVAKHQVSRPTAPTGSTSVTVTAAPADSDGVTMTAAPVTAAISPLYFGRLRIPNGAGSQFRNLSLGISTQFYNGSGYVTNTDDSCTQIPATAFNFGNFRKTLTVADAVVVGAPVVFAKGAATLTLQKPGGTRTGTYDLAVSLGAVADASCLQVWAPTSAATTSANLSFLQGNWCGATYAKDPSARISFGVYKGANSIVYQRENF